MFAKRQPFLLKINEKLPGNGYKSVTKDNNMFQYQLQRQDYWMKTLRTPYPYRLNERANFMNKGNAINKFFPPLPGHGQGFIDTRTRSKINNYHLSSEFESSFNFLN